MKKRKKIILLTLLVFVVLSLSGCSQDLYESPIGAEGVGVGWFQKSIITWIADAFYWVSHFFGGYYWAGIIVITLIIRTIGWPIYASTNGMTMKMQVAQPEINKIQEKYAGKTDQQSQRMMQQETMAVYKKYNINFLGCFLPFLQMPIFIAVYQIVRRVPKTPEFSDLDYSFLWINDLNGPDKFRILPIMVAILMFFSQRYSQKKPEYMNNKKYEKTTQQPNPTQGSMKFMMYFMVIMLTFIAWDNAGIALYWIIGTSFQIFQTYITRMKSAKKMDEYRRIV